MASLLCAYSSLSTIVVVNHCYLAEKRSDEGCVVVDFLEILSERLWQGSHSCCCHQKMHIRQQSHLAFLLHHLLREACLVTMMTYASPLIRQGLVR